MKEVRHDPCTFDGCEAAPLYDLKRGLCKGHYMWHHDRGLLGPKPTTVELLASHWRRITPEGCWEWRGSISSEGYGRHRTDYVHRVSWEQVNGPIPEGLHIDHLCRNRRCFRPDHLEAVTPAVNSQRGILAHIVRTGLCHAGHRMDEDNTYLYRPKNGRTRRICRTCQHIRYQKRIARAAGIAA